MVSASWKGSRDIVHDGICALLFGGLGRAEFIDLADDRMYR
jgi:hypothetical protein